MNEAEKESTAPENDPITPEPTNDIVIEHVRRPEWLKRMMEADSLEDFLGIPRGGHRDPSPGEARPRWPNP